MKPDFSPEERLLKLIRHPKKQNIAIEKKSPSIALDLNPVFRPSIYTSMQKYLSFVYLQKIILLIFIAVGSYFIVSFIYPWIGYKKIILPPITQEKIMGSEIESNKQEVKPYEFYLEGLKNRQIFGSSTLPETQAGASPAINTSPDLTKDMNLVGIVSGNNPQAIIEDKKAGKTYYETKGQSIGEFQVEDIQEGKVILDYHNQRCELYL